MSDLLLLVTCLECGRNIVTRIASRLYCSKECWDKARAKLLSDAATEE